MNSLEFEKQLQHIGRLYESLSPIPAAAVQIRFTGPFEQKSVIWQAQIATLAYYSKECATADDSPVILKPFIDVGENNDTYRLIRIGLNVPIIDEATIRKTIIMIRQYRLLRKGRYDYGEPFDPAATIG